MSVPPLKVPRVELDRPMSLEEAATLGTHYPSLEYKYLFALAVVKALTGAENLTEGQQNALNLVTEVEVMLPTHWSGRVK